MEVKEGEENYFKQFSIERKVINAWDNCLIIHVYSQNLTANSLL